MTETTELNLESFFSSDDLHLTKIVENEDVIRIYLKSITTSCECPQRQIVSTQYHGTHQQTVQDLPILGKSVQLKIRAHEYHCSNPDCSATSFSENFACFLAPRRRMMERCQTFICALALETSAEGCTRVCQQMGLQISGDTVIRLLLRKFSEHILAFLERRLVWMTFLLRKGEPMVRFWKIHRYNKQLTF